VREEVDSSEICRPPRLWDRCRQIVPVAIAPGAGLPPLRLASLVGIVLAL
jgi:hypothetical protein